MVSADGEFHAHGARTFSYAVRAPPTAYSGLDSIRYVRSLARHGRHGVRTRDPERDASTHRPCRLARPALSYAFALNQPAARALAPTADYAAAERTEAAPPRARLRPTQVFQPFDPRAPRARERF